jgi:hypothetical protein
VFQDLRKYSSFFLIVHIAQNTHSYNTPHERHSHLTRYQPHNSLITHITQAFDPAAYFMFLQLRTVGTGVAFQFLFSKKLSGLQWLSLVLVTLGCIVQGGASKDSKGNTQWSEISLILMLVQVRARASQSLNP